MNKGAKSAGRSRFEPREVEQWLARLASPDSNVAKSALGELGKRGWAVAEAVLPRFDAATPPLRGRLCALVARVAARAPDQRAREFLLLALDDADPRTRRSAALGLGKVGHGDAEPALLAAYERAPDPALRRAILASLGKVGGARSLDLLRGVQADDPETARVVAEARLKLEREQTRDDESVIALDGVPSRPIPITFHCRAGLETLLASELDERWAARVAGKGSVTATLEGPLASVFVSRIASYVAFRLPIAALGAGETVELAVVRSLTSEPALALFRTFTRGAPRYRLEWVGAGHRRGLTYRVARGVSARCPELVNDPTRSLWEARISERRDGIAIELRPRLADPRFDYRAGDVPAASHPTIAAALARVAAALPEDVVWDPFTGSGLELVERGLLGPYARLIGSDLDARALETARRNVSAARLQRVELIRGDARSVALPSRVHAVITNPPFGKRVALDGDLLPLFGALFARLERTLVPGGRFVWVSPLPDSTLELAARARLSPALRQRIDMGGFDAELQAFRRSG